jgi:molybdopterin converting factor subunit 1
VRVTVRLFARLRDLVGAGELQRSMTEGATVATVWESLVRDYPAIAPYAASISCAINAEYARMTSRVADGDEVAFLPPVSGGDYAD